MRAARLALAAPRHADQKAKAEREANGRERTLRDDVLERFLDRQGRILGCVHDGAAAFGNIVDRRIDVVARLLVAAARLLLGGTGE